MVSPQDFLPVFKNTIFQHLSIISSLFIIVWSRGIKGGFLIDDQDGIAKWSERFLPERRDQAGTIFHEEVVDSEVVNNVKKKFLSYRSDIGFPGALLRFIRLHLGKKFTVIGKNKKGHPVYGYVQDPVKHHIVSLISQQINLVLCYFFLHKIFGSQVAFYSTLLFAIYPLSSQAVAWISGVNYLWCLFGILSILNVSVYISDYHWSIPLTVFLNAVSAFSLVPGCFTWVILILLGKYWAAFASFCVSIAIFSKIGPEVVNFRKSAFIEQNMGKPTRFNIRKPIVVLKTLWYYFKNIVTSSKLGLFHVWGYHYDEQMEHFDGLALKGLLSVLALSVLAIKGGFVFSFCVVWFFVYLFTFLNLITAQQFVVDRYVFIPSLAYCVLISYLLKDYPYVLYFIVGLYTCRVLMHLRTFKNDTEFYKSNVWNFPTSEVALGNLGVSYMNQGREGSAVDTWIEAIQINPLYDVPHYNLYSIFRTKGILDQARHHLVNCLNSKTVHFQKQWESELVELDKMIEKQRKFNEINAKVNEAINSNKYDLLPQLKEEMNKLNQATP